MKIIYLHQYFTTPEMPGGTRSYEFARRLVASGHEVHMISSWRGDSGHSAWYSEKIDGIQVHWLPVRYSNKMGFWQRLWAFAHFALAASVKAASFKDADVIFATSTPLTIALPGVYASRRLGVPMVFEVRDLWPEVPIALGVLKNAAVIKLARWLERFAYRHSTRVVALAPGMADGVSASGYDPARIAIIPNGCDREFFEMQNRESPEAKTRDLVEILYIGTVGPANGVEYIPRLAAELKRRYPGLAVRFVIVGDGKCLEPVKSLAEELGVAGRWVRFVGEVPKREVPKWLKRCQVTIMTYDGPEILYRDSVSNKFFDSIAAARPVIANFRGFSTRVAAACHAGKILPRDDYPRAADELARLLEDRQFWERAPLACRELAEKYFDRDSLAKLLEKVLLEAASNSKPGLSTVGGEYRDLWRNSTNVQLG